MNTALIGYTGFVGSNLNNQFNFSSKYNSKNIQQICMNKFDLIVCAAAPGIKWKANKFPHEDALRIENLMNSLKRVNTKKFILISTVDVYNSTKDVNEETKIFFRDLNPYGKHRYVLEEFIRNNFKENFVIRLPALFGDGIKKNFIYDLINNKNLNLTNSDSEYQFYNLTNLWKDIEICIKNNLKLINLTSEPIKAKTIAEYCLNLDFFNDKPLPVNYNIKSLYSRLFSGDGGYIYKRKTILDEIREFIRKERSN